MHGRIPGEEDVSPGNMTRWTNANGVVIENENRLLDDQTEPPVQQHTAVPQPPTTLESALAHVWFNESFLISAVETDIRAAQQHVSREETDLTPRTLTNQQRNDRGRPASPEHRLTPQQRDTDVEPNGVFFPNNESCNAYADTEGRENIRLNHIRRKRTEEIRQESEQPPAPSYVDEMNNQHPWWNPPWSPESTQHVTVIPGFDGLGNGDLLLNESARPLSIADYDANQQTAHLDRLRHNFICREDWERRGTVPGDPFDGLDCRQIPGHMGTTPADPHQDDRYTPEGQYTGAAQFGYQYQPGISAANTAERNARRRNRDCEVDHRARSVHRERFQRTVWTRILGTSG